MTMSPFGPSPDPFSELLNRFFGMSPAASPPGVQRVPTGRLLSEAAKELISLASRRAADDGSPELDTGHLLWAATRVEPSRGLLAAAGADPDRLAAAVAEALPGAGAAPGAEPGLTPAAKRTLSVAHARSQAAGGSYIGPEHVLGALLDDPGSGAGRLLRAAHLDTGRLRAGESAAARTQGGARSAGTALGAYGRDLTAEASAGRLDPVVGRAPEIEETAEILSRRTRNNPVLVGEPGVGRTAVVEGLAQRIASGEVPGGLAGLRVVALDLAGLVAASRPGGDVAERLRQVIDEVRAAARPTVLFIDTPHTAVGAGAGDAVTVLRDALARGELRVIGATTVDGFRRHVASDPALERRCQPVTVTEPGVTGTAEILAGLRDSYEAHHQVRFADEALTAAAELSDRYLTGRRLPGKAIDLLDQAGARVRLTARDRPAGVTGREAELARLRREKDQAIAGEDYERAAGIRRRIAEVEDELAGLAERRVAVATVTAADVAEVLARRTGIPVSRLTESERERLLKLEHALRERVAGQDQAVTAVAEAVRRDRAGLGDPDRPIASFLFLGPSGVGRTTLARALAALLFGGEDRLARFGMSEYQERHAAGRLTERVRRQPYSVLLFDEIEKAHPDVLGALRQALDGGLLTDGQGRTVSFRTTVVVMTSGIGAHRVLAHGGAADEVREDLMKDLAGRFPPGFLDCIDETVVFRRLGPAALDRVVDLLLEPSRRRVRAQGMRLEVTGAARRLLAGHGQRPEQGARPLPRAIRTELDNRVAALLLSDGARVGDTITADARDGELVCVVGTGGGTGTDAETEQAEADAEAEGWPPA